MADSIPRRLLANSTVRPTSVAYYSRDDGQWRPTTWRAFVDEVKVAARAMLALGVGRGDRVCILGFNRPEWVIFDHAAMMIGAVPAGIYTTCSADEVHYIVEHSEAKLVLVEGEAQLAKVHARRSELPALTAVVLMRGGDADGRAGVLSWADLECRAAEIDEAALVARLDDLAPDQVATLIYTSGTTGPPKAVMLSHRNLCWTSTRLCEVNQIGEADRLLSYLPLSHIAEQMATIHVPASSGCTIYYAESIDRVGDNLKIARPTIFFGVPRIWEKMAAAIEARLVAATGVKKALVARTRAVCLEVWRRRGVGRALGPRLTLEYRLFTRLVTSKVKAAIGLDCARIASSGAAPIAREVLDLFASLDLPVYEVYGQSEGSGPTTANRPGHCKLGTVGRAVPGVEVKLADDGEVLVKGPNVFLGYLKDPKATAEALADGWMYSGDLGAFDDDGYLSITGRKKEIIITSGGKNISPRNLEDALRESELIADAVVIGDRRKHLTALIVVDDEHARRWLEGARASDPGASIEAAVLLVVDAVNSRTAQVARIKRFTVLPAAFSIEGGELTPTLKLKRAAVAAKYRAEIEAMYADE